MGSHSKLVLVVIEAQVLLEILRNRQGIDGVIGDVVTNHSSETDAVSHQQVLESPKGSEKSLVV